MSVLYIVLPLALLFAGGAVAVFIWATKRGQFDDLETPARRVLFDEEPQPRQAAAEPGPQLASQGPQLASQGPQLASQGPQLASQGPQLASQGTRDR